MTPMTNVPYQYWTGTQWMQSDIYIGPVMKTGWHIFNIVLCLVFPPWLFGYLAVYWSLYNDACTKTDRALAEIARYYADLDKARDDQLRQTGMIE